MTREEVYWGVLAPEDKGVPEMFFHNEALARQSVADVRRGMYGPFRVEIQLVRVRVVLVEIEPVDGEG